MKKLGTRTIICKQCKKEYTYNRSIRNGASATICNICRVSNRRREIKRLAVEYKGGKCSICGYNKCIDALDFHHINPFEKEFSISHDGYTKSFDKVKVELDKCILVCSNCHRELHSIK